MPYESPVPPVPTRLEEKAFIERMEREFLAQPNYKLYMNENLRTRKIDDSVLMNKVKRDFIFNLGVGGIVSGLAVLPLGKLFQHASSGAPFYYRPKMYLPSFEYYNQWRNTVRKTAMVSTWAVLTFGYAYRFTSYEDLDDEYFAKIKPAQMF